MAHLSTLREAEGNSLDAVRGHARRLAAKWGADYWRVCDRERAFPKYAAAMAWERQHLQELLRR